MFYRALSPKSSDCHSSRWTGPWSTRLGHWSRRVGQLDLGRRNRARCCRPAHLDHPRLLGGTHGVDAIAFVSMSAALALGQNLAGVVVAVMYAGGNVLEDFAVARAERNLKSLIDRAPRIAHRRQGTTIDDVPIEQVAVGDTILVRAGEVIPVDGTVTSPGAMIDEAALTGEPIPVARREGEPARSGTVNVGETFEIRATATAGESTYAGIVRMVNAAQTAKAPFSAVN
jgi:cation transport ATPase